MGYRTIAEIQHSNGDRHVSMPGLLSRTQSAVKPSRIVSTRNLAMQLTPWPRLAVASVQASAAVRTLSSQELSLTTQNDSLFRLAADSTLAHHASVRELGGDIRDAARI